jgi:hypothetical protein
MRPAQPTRPDERLSAMTRIRLLLVAIGLVAGLAVAPTARVAACDCAMTELLAGAAALGVISVAWFRRGAR